MRRKLAILAVLSVVGMFAATVAPAPVKAQTCVPYGYLCDPRYVPSAVCCPGTHCTYLYPGVPLYCL
jgi:hypothetical protein